MNGLRVVGVALLLLGGSALVADAEAKSSKMPVTKQFGSGARVDEVAPDSAAANAGMKPGDLILAIDGKPINSPQDINPLLAASGKHPLVFDLDRGGTRMLLKVTPQVVTESGVQHKVLGISHTDLVSDPKERPHDLYHIMFSPEPAKPKPGVDQKPGTQSEPEREGPNDLYHIIFPDKQ